jgi:hypothetical protein
MFQRGHARGRFSLLALTLLSGATLTALATTPQDDKEELRAQIMNSVERGKDFLINRQRGDGSWTHVSSGYEGHNIGATALCGIALMECMVPPNDDRLKRTTAIIRKAAKDPNFNYNYAVNLCILYLHRVNQTEKGGWVVDHPDAHLVRDLALRVAHGQDPQGGGWSYILRGGVTDNSNTQFGVIGLWVSRKYFPDKSDERRKITDALRLAEQKFRKSQHSSGSWAYDMQNTSQAPSPAMTCAGLLGLAVGTGNRFQTEFQGAGSGSGSTGAVYGRLDTDPQVILAKAYLQGAMRPYQEGRGGGEHAIYFLWSLERLCVLYRWKTLGDIDWHAAGSRFLFSKQNAAGGWELDLFSGTHAETAFALLFLMKSNLLGPLEEATFTGGSITAGGPEKKAPTIKIDVKQRVKDIFAELPGATPEKRYQLLREAERLPGQEVTDKLIEAIAKMPNDTAKDTVRETLARRIEPLNLTNLRKMINDPEKRELRLAAIRAAGAKTEDKDIEGDAKTKAERHDLLVDLIGTLSDPDTQISDQAVLSLQLLTNQPFRKDAQLWSKWLDRSKKE